MLDIEVIALATEPVSAKKQREFLVDRIAKLEDGSEILREVIVDAVD
jgi:hypothetical protein